MERIEEDVDADGDVGLPRSEREITITKNNPIKEGYPTIGTCIHSGGNHEESDTNHRIFYSNDFRLN